ncbi:U3 snoRNP protein [Lobosporangium transversale]|uniref:U3 small nucleolar RNA-associated protein 6-domain-containing protein n=1 Tax=Lobosporangium transversale TaxID=64571 RepID=A0A1Y2GVG3_9FUNG|nr:U3 small nucleolar RNA-associated protein 6-domain-containing protein [Lobosporangium transversale]KAF9916500.1 U3 snoRNP protein [Lobosporangium transversale]ORZ26288.1 U3 small nucleolar RNA-associated protein 6-domain-containing protein [Lobosporangium transversale]|eukprot:XP_021884053.1 U3 small nucleolar RNA-associated protein 6-domain-containing protein [Lobosporangium transversale]
MADTVQFYMEEMIPELRDLEQKGIFSKKEIQSIIKKREKFEYALKRRISKKADYLRYIEYEMNLEALRKKRRARMVSNTKQSISDYAGQRRIYFIYKRCLTKFKGDISIWLQYINYAKKTGASRTLGKIFAQAIQLHPTNEKMWILAAAWEWEENANIVAARVLLQRALRLNTTTESLWHEYFRLELVYIAKILARRQVLGIDVSEEEIEENLLEDREVDTDNMIKLPSITGEEFSALDQDEKGVLGKKLSKKGKKEKKKAPLTEEKAEAFKTEKNPVLRGEVAMVVYRNGIKSIPNSFSFRKGFLDIANSFIRPKPLNDDSIQYIYDSINADFKDLPEARALVARRAIDAYKVDEEGYVKGVGETVKAFWQLCDDNDPRMWKLFVENMEAEYQKTEEENLKLYFSKTIDRIFSSADKKNIHSEDLCLLQINWILSSSTLSVENVNKKALTILDQAIAKYPASRALVLQQIRLLRTLSRSEQTARLPAIFAHALKTHTESLDIWREYISFIRTAYREDDMSKQQVEEAFLDAVRTTTALLPDVTEERAEVGQVKHSVSAWFLDWMNETEGIEGVRRVYQTLLKKSLPEPGFFMTCINLEKKNSINEEASRKAICMLYDKAIHADEKNEDIYLSFLKFLNETGQVEMANKVLWRAGKAAADSDAFSQRYREMLEGKWSEPSYLAAELDLDMEMDSQPNEEALSS